ncbi:GNAT family N-acetyltransferase [Cupriavidus sp. 2TAF22]|uniref:GNAT family N-acetyltransferase n=1 Tax=unclassified Cupriavidus TaxID=2640874 RepID=UPI003F903D27
MQALHGQGFQLRPFRYTDVPQFVAAVHESLDTVGKWMPWCHASYSVRDAESWFDMCTEAMGTGEAYDIGVFAPDGRELYGGVSINQINRDYNFGNLGYWIRQSRQRQGLGARAADLMACYGFHRLGLTRLEVVAAENNVLSRAVAEKIGAQFECIARNRLVLHGVPCAAAMYSLVPPWYQAAGQAGSARKSGAA